MPWSDTEMEVFRKWVWPENMFLRIGDFSTAAKPRIGFSLPPTFNYWESKNDDVHYQCVLDHLA